MLTSTSPIDQSSPLSSSPIMPTNKLAFFNSSSTFPSSQATTSTVNNSNVSGVNMGRYSPSNFYRAAAVAAASSESNNRRYMPGTPVSAKMGESKN